MTTDTIGRYAPDHIKRLKDAIEGECDGLTINDKHAEAILQYVFEDATHALRAAQRPVCQTCNGVGLIGGHSGQTPESYQEHSEDCPDCTPQRPAAQDDRAAFEAWAEDQEYPLVRERDTGFYVDDGAADAWNGWQAALASRPVPPPISDDAETQRGLMLSWAVDRWNAEVKNRPLVNVHRRTLDDTWRQVMRYCGGDPSALVGPSHDDLLDAAPKRNGIPIAEERTTQPQASRCGLPECFGKPMCQKCTDQQIRQAVDGHANESQWKGGV